MSVLIFFAVSLAGGLGAVLRMVVDGWVKFLVGGSWPWATAIINVTGSLALGVVTGLATGHVMGPELQATVGTGFLGGYTTFSTASLEAVTLIQSGRWNASLLYAIGLLIVAIAAAGLGMWLGLLIGGD
ncbi:fluoride efflux transporter CrcB [Curtobacterium sp. S6]|uniref:fluoride efflux transporter CrcB n=1 Tax=Curtobacterium sp. S6 TaxID=1479623 RepID=UPI0004AA250F|nr:fluoride efflux transporter CrcB [Curtobacterium sp. S6]